MAIFKIIHREELVDWFYVEADSKEEALKRFEYLSQDGQIDYTDMEMSDSSDEVEPVRPEDVNSYIERRVYRL